MNEELTNLISALDEWGNKNGNRYLLFVYKEEDDAVSFVMDEKSHSLKLALVDLLMHDDELYRIVEQAHDLARIGRRWKDDEHKMP